MITVNNVFDAPSGLVVIFLGLPFSNHDRKGEDGVQGIRSATYRPGVTEGIIKEAQKKPEGKASLPAVSKY